MVQENQISFKKLQEIRNVCLGNAESLINSAKSLLDKDVCHICYHLAVLALEEIGKFNLIESKYQFIRQGYEDKFNPDLDDRVKKWFWAIWGMAFNPVHYGEDDYRNELKTVSLI